MSEEIVREDLVELRNVSERMRMPYDCQLGHGLPVDAGATGHFDKRTAEQLLREEPGVWELVQAPAHPDLPAAPAKE